MNHYNQIIDKLERFIRKYYTNELLKGIILFFAIGLLYFLLTVFLEWALWLSPLSRTILFWTFIAVEIALFGRFIIYPLSKLFKLSKGISYEQASAIIGQHFTEVNDKLLNVLQLKQNTESSELLLASIDQKAEELQPIQFNFAVNFKDNTKYLKYLAIPVLILLAIWISGKSNLFTESYDRVVNYQQAYEPPAPFQFFVVNDNLDAKENQDFTIEVRTTGNIIPQEATINYNGETYFMKSVSTGVFQYTFNQLKEPLSFYLSANEVKSIPYTISLTKVPTLLSFNMALNYPAYTGRRDEVLQGTGSATIPEGTTITWDLATQSTSQVSMILRDTTQEFTVNDNTFSLQKRIFNNFNYEISTSNEQLKNYENLAYGLRVIKDQYPELVLKSETDSLNKQAMYFFGSASDDYGLSKLELVYYPSEDEASSKKLPIAINSTTYDDFVYAFPDTLSLPKGVPYNFYFQVFDNDRVNGSKRVKSEVFSFRKLTDNEVEEQQFEEQKETISGMNKSLEKMKEREKELEELNQLQKEKEALNFNDKKKLEEFLKRQKQQEQIMQQFSKKMKENLQQFQQDNPENDPVKQKLEERFQRNEEQLKKNEELLEELQKVQDKINKEELSEKLEKLAKQNQNEEKNLEQLLELTKRYYVEKKALKVAEDLEKLAQKQEELSKKDGDENTKEAQEELNKEFQKLQEDLKDLEDENKDLKEPMDISRDEEKEESIKKDQEDASEKLDSESKENQEEELSEQNNSDKHDAQKKQKSAADKMKEMGQKMASQMQESGESGESEDAEMLRQILDNLVTFSFEQEGLMDDFKVMERNNPAFAKKLKRQSVLRENFTHIDDSLYALSLRNAELGEIVNEKLTDIEFNIDKSLERLSDNYLPQGISNQQYTVTAANELAFLLANSLDNMNASMGSSGKGKSGKGKGKGKGEGQGKGFQLPDIIKKQEELGEQLKNGMKPGQKLGEGSQGKNGKSGEGGEGGSSGENGKPGTDGKNGNKEGEGKDGNQLDEQMSGELFEIYQKQQQLRNQLEDKIREEGLGADAERLAKQMEQVEQSLLDKGFDNKVLQQMTNLKHQLLKLDSATLEQGQDDKRESKSNLKSFSNPTNSHILKAKEYFNTTEILNRQTLPLRQDYKQKVQDYFKEND